jgi:hypothetical protein
MFLGSSVHPMVWRWVALVGLVLQAVGVAVALWGLGETYRDITTDNLARDMARRAWRGMQLWRAPDPVVVEGKAASIMALAGRAFATSAPPRPPDDASLGEKVDHLMDRVDELAREITGARMWASEEATAAEKRANERTREVAGRVDAVEGHVTSLRVTLGGGRDGRGLRVAAWGLVVTIVGTLLGAPAIFWT